MEKRSFIQGFSKLTDADKCQAIATLTKNPEKFLDDLQKHLHVDNAVQARYNSFSENTLTNY